MPTVAPQENPEVASSTVPEPSKVNFEICKATPDFEVNIARSFVDDLCAQGIHRGVSDILGADLRLPYPEFSFEL